MPLLTIKQICEQKNPKWKVRTDLTEIHESYLISSKTNPNDTEKQSLENFIESVKKDISEHKYVIFPLMINFQSENSWVIFIIRGGKEEKDEEEYYYYYISSNFDKLFERKKHIEPFVKKIAESNDQFFFIYSLTPKIYQNHDYNNGIFIIKYIQCLLKLKDGKITSQSLQDLEISDEEIEFFHQLSMLPCAN